VGNASTMTERKRKLQVFEDGGGINGGAPQQPRVNPYNGRPYSNKYYEILEKRKGEKNTHFIGSPS
jgi:hypothetical protein